MLRDERSQLRGDTIIEVMLAFAIFAALAVSVTVLMNRSLATGQRSLETTLVRQQVDAQAELLRYARDNQLPVWATITGSLASTPGPISYAQCPSAPGNNSFFLVPSTGPGGETLITRRTTSSPGAYELASYISGVDFGESKASGFWITPVRAEGDGAYDMYIRACWNSVGQTVPMQVSTIVRLYET